MKTHPEDKKGNKEMQTHARTMASRPRLFHECMLIADQTSFAGRLSMLRTMLVEKPTLPISALAFFCVLAGLSVAIVLQASFDYAELEKSKAAFIISSHAGNFESLLTGALFSAQTVRSFVEAGPSPVHSQVLAFFDGAAPELLASSTAIDDIQLAPYGVAAAIYPIVSARRDSTGLYLAGGHDLFDENSSIANRRAAAMLGLESRRMQIEGPKTLFGGENGVDAKLGLLARAPMFAATASATDPWGDITWPCVPGLNCTLGPFRNVSDCSGAVSASTGRLLCETNALGDGLRFWGFYTVIVIWEEIIKLAHIPSLGDAGYKWSISRSVESSDGTGDFEWTFVGANEGELSPDSSKGGIVSVVSVETSTWAFTIDRKGGWEPAWKDGLVAGVIAMAAALSCVVLHLLIQHQLYLNLLYSMLPRRIVGKIKSRRSELTDTTAEPFEHATILFSDIVNYTTLVNTISPQATMNMLNTLFSAFDQLVERNGVQKVETIGDAYMVVAGTPDPGGPKDQALAMAHMALDMLECISALEAPDGSRLTIRIGIHCGPVVTGVVGLKMPRWCLFGDTVNVSSRMESTSVKGMIQISAPLAALLGDLAQDPEARFDVIARGTINIKGKGLMKTAWLVQKGYVIPSVLETPPTSLDVPHGGSIRDSAVFTDSSVPDIDEIEKRFASSTGVP